MPMLTRANFVAQLTLCHGSIYLGAPVWNHRVSSTLNLVNAVAAYNLAPGSAAYLLVHQEIQALPAAKKLRYANAIRALQQSMGNVYVTANPFTIHFAQANAIGVPRVMASPQHQTDALLALHQLHGVPAGMALMQAICNRTGVNGKRVAIQPWDAQNTNKCHVVGMAAVKTDLADALENNRGQAGAAILAALNALNHPPLGGGYAWLSGQVDATPIYDLQGLPNANASSTVHGAGWVSAAMIQNWCTNATVFPAPLIGPQVQDAALVLATVLQGGATAGGGEHAMVRWNVTSVQFTDTLGVVRQRPPYIAMAHELIHGYHNLLGDQAGHEIGTYSRVLYEYQCVGLGPWAGSPHTENAVRASANLALRTCY